MKYYIQYQKWNSETNQPFDFAINEEPLEFDRLELIPNVNDYIRFLDKAAGVQGLFRVRSRLFTHTLNPKGRQQQVMANIVVEEAGNMDELIKN